MHASLLLLFFLSFLFSRLGLVLKDFHHWSITSWPSGHAATAMSGLVFLAYVLWSDLVALVMVRPHVRRNQGTGDGPFGLSWCCVTSPISLSMVTAVPTEGMSRCFLLFLWRSLVSTRP